MPKYAPERTGKIYEAGELFLKRCLLGSGSLFWDGAEVWTVPNLTKLREVFIDHPDTSKRSFLEKFADQVRPAGPDACKLAAEIMAVYFLFLSNVLSQTKLRTVETILGWGSIPMPADGIVLQALRTEGIGSGGQGYNTRRPNEVEFLIEFALRWKALPPDQQEASAQAPWKFMNVTDDGDNDSSQLRHILLHILFPDTFERIASGVQKRRVNAAFKSLVDSEELEADQSLAVIRKKLGPLLKRPDFDFYDQDVLNVWDATGQFAEGGSHVEALLYKKQAVLYGPPGTSKTYQAKRLAATLIREAILEQWGAKEYFEKRAAVEQEIIRRTHRLQLHPGWSYENFVLGLHINDSGATEYRPGYLLNLVDQMTDSLPHVLILDEINRTDLSRMLGEAFSLLENREEKIDLSVGKGFTLKLPRNLYLIATMNLIDQSVEQLDFALRRRFLWILCPFDSDLFIEAARERWEQTKAKTPWAAIHSDFIRLAEAAKALNQEIQSSSLLGAQYEIGHTYLLDAVEFLKREQVTKPRARLWKKGGARLAVKQIWDFSLRPLIEEYLAGQDAKERESAISRFQQVFLCPPELPE